MAKAVASGMPKLRIEEAAAKKQARIDSEAGNTLTTILSNNFFHIIRDYCGSEQISPGEGRTS